MKPWKSATPEMEAAGAEALQWGHGDEAVEEWPWVDSHYEPARASMGPRR